MFAKAEEKFIKAQWKPFTPIAKSSQDSKPTGAANSMDLNEDGKKNDSIDCDSRVGSKSGCEEVVARNGTLPTLAPVADVTEKDEENADEAGDCDSRVGSKSGCEEVVARNGTLPTLAPVADVTEKDEENADEAGDCDSRVGSKS